MFFKNKLQHQGPHMVLRLYFLGVAAQEVTFPGSGMEIDFLGFLEGIVTSWIETHVEINIGWQSYKNSGRKK